MKKNESWALCKFKDDIEGVRVYKVAEDYILTNFRDEPICVVPPFGRDPKMHAMIAEFMAFGFSDTFWGFMCGRDDKSDSLECFLCNELHNCSSARWGDENCIVKKQFDEEYGS